GGGRALPGWPHPSRLGVPGERSLLARLGARSAGVHRHVTSAKGGLPFCLPFRADSDLPFSGQSGLCHSRAIRLCHSRRESAFAFRRHPERSAKARSEGPLYLLLLVILSGTRRIPAFVLAQSTYTSECDSKFLLRALRLSARSPLRQLPECLHLAPARA